MMRTNELDFREIEIYNSANVESIRSIDFISNSEMFLKHVY